MEIKKGGVCWRVVGRMSKVVSLKERKLGLMY